MKLHFSLLALLAASILSAQEIDTTIFSNTFEKEIIVKMVDSSDFNAFDAFMALNHEHLKTKRCMSQFNSLIASLEARGIAQKPDKKKIKDIYKIVHSTLLKKYVEDIYFDDLFQTGEYNCVTASALYAMVFDHFNIDYVIKETPTHVYLIASPGKEDFLIETTTPTKGVFIFDEKYKKDYVEYLNKNKIISDAEFNLKSTSSLFDEFYDENKSISLQELVGIHYYNKAVSTFNDSKYEQSARNIEKAYLIYPSNTIQYNFNAILLNVLNEQHTKKKYSGVTLAKYVNLNKEDAEAISYSSDYFDVVSEEYVINHPNLSKYNKFYDEFSDLLHVDVDLDEYNQTYYHLLGYHSYLDEDYTQSLNYLNFAYISNPENLRTKELIKNMASNKMFTDKKHLSMIDTIETYFEIFPFLAERQNFNEYYAYCYAVVISDFVYDNEISKGIEYLNRFESNIGNNTIEIDQEIHEDIYHSLSAYYIRKRKYQTAMQYVQHGLMKIPDSRVLKDQKSNILTYQKYVSDVEETVHISVPSKQEEFSETFYRVFPDNCWSINSIIIDGEEQDVEGDENLHIVAEKSYKKATFIFDGEEIKGKWAVRTKSKLLYLIPERNKEDYLMFKIVSITDDEIRLRYYDENKFERDIIVLSACGD